MRIAILTSLLIGATACADIEPAAESDASPGADAELPCGNGALDDGEACDVGDADDGGGCNADCSVATCLVPLTHSSIQEAVADTACPSVFVAPGTYQENLTLARDVNLVGVGNEPAFIDGQGADVLTIGTEDTRTSVTLKRITIRGGVVGVRSGNAELAIEDCSIEGNQAGVILRTTEATIARTTIRDNHLPASVPLLGGAGIGIFSNSSAVISDSTIADNSMERDFGGTAISILTCDAVEQSLVLRRSLVRDNTAVGPSETSAGLWSGLSCDVVIENSTFTGNRSPRPGAALNLEGNAAIVNSTIVDNVSESGAGGVLHRDSEGSLYLANSIVTRNGAQNCTSFPDVTGQYNLLGVNATTCRADDTTLQADDPGLAELADNGGATWSMMPETASMAVNGGDPDGCKGPGGDRVMDDQRAKPRDAASRCDVGAIER